MKGTPYWQRFCARWDRLATLNLPSGAMRTVMLAALRYADVDGFLYVGKQTWARCAMLPVRTVERAVAALVGLGHLIVVESSRGGLRKTAKYRVRFIAESPDNPDTASGIEPRQHGLETPTPKRVNPDRDGEKPRHAVGGTTENHKENNSNNPAAVADSFARLGIESLRGHPNATPERLAWIEREAPNMTNPGGWAAAAIRKGWPVPPPGPADVAAARKVDRGARLAAFDAMPPSERAAIIAAARAAFPNLASEPDESPGVRGAVLRVLRSRESNGTSASLRPPRDLPSRPLERHP